MSIEKMKSQFANTYKSLLKPISEALNQLCGQTIELKHQLQDDTDVSTLLEKEKLPRVFFQFVCQGQNKWTHWLSLPQELVLDFYASMVGDDPAENIADEHLEGIQEGIKQVFGQLESFLEEDTEGVKFESLEVSRVEDIADMPDDAAVSDGLGAQYELSMGEKQHKIMHYFYAEFDESTDSEATEKAQASKTEAEKVDVNPAEFQPFDSSEEGNGGSRNLDMLLDVQLEAVVELGRKSIPIKDVLKLGRGSIIELEKTAGEPLDIYLNGRKLAEGEVVVVDEQFGIRITHLVEPRERIKSLK